MEPTGEGDKSESRGIGLSLSAIPADGAHLVHGWYRGIHDSKLNGGGVDAGLGGFQRIAERGCRDGG